MISKVQSEAVLYYFGDIHFIYLPFKPFTLPKVNVEQNQLYENEDPADPYPFSFFTGL